jgi:hypothetical protein
MLEATRWNNGKAITHGPLRMRISVGVHIDMERTKYCIRTYTFLFKYIACWSSAAYVFYTKSMCPSPAVRHVQQGVIHIVATECSVFCCEKMSRSPLLGWAKCIDIWMYRYYETATSPYRSTCSVSIMEGSDN